MDCKIAKGKFDDLKCDALIALRYQDDAKAGGPFGKLIESAYRGGHFRGAIGELFQIYPLANARASRLILVGLGKRKGSTPESIRKAAGTVTRTVRKLNSIAYLPLDNPQETIVSLIDGTILGNYRFDRLKSEKEESKLKTANFFVDGASISNSLLQQARITDEGTLAARDLANLPANLLTPSALANDALRQGRKHGIAVKILDEAQMARHKMGSLLAVARGSANRPKMVIWEYKGGKAGAAPYVIVGKGVTFDSGGISIKPAEGMEAMKGDMAGAATVISLISVVGQIRPKINIVGIAPLVENMPSGSAYRPGDILTASNGKTIEVITTDAEGRLILADALVYARRYKPRYIVDIATLTGACVVALGQHICAGVMGTDQGLIEALVEAGNQTGERLWQLPLWDDYKELLKTPVADMKNTGGRWGGAITAGTFLSYFAEGTPWAHLDIAGTDSEETSNHPYRYKGATGWGVRLLSRFILNKAG